MKNKILLMSLVINLISFVSAHVGDDDFAHHSMMDGMMNWNYSGIWEMGIFAWIFGILGIILLVLLIIWLIKQIEKNKK